MDEGAPVYKRILADATEFLSSFAGHSLDVLDVAKPTDLEYAILLSKVISKLSPMLGNMIEYRVVSKLNERGGWPEGRWHRQDPGFPDTLFAGSVTPSPGIEIKTWFPLATEITARFKESITRFDDNQTNVALIAWMPEGVIFGKPKVIAVWIDTALSVAIARDTHYHNPPDYLVFEPLDTSDRTRNLQQTNTNGFKFQGSPEDLEKAKKLVAGWGTDGKTFSFTPEYQEKLGSLMGSFPGKYRLDTNFAKMDRIKHPTLEQFKQRVLAMVIKGHNVKQWQTILKGSTEPKYVGILKELIEI